MANTRIFDQKLKSALNIAVSEHSLDNAVPLDDYSFDAFLFP